MKCITHVLLVGLLLTCASAARGETIEWIRQPGTARHTGSRGVSADELGNVYISGHTGGSLSGPSAGGDDAFVSKYDATGNQLWTRQFGTTDTDGSRAVSTDRLGSVYVSGFTNGSLGGPNAGTADAFVRKYDSTGGLLWTRQLGTARLDESLGVSADGLGNVYISGYTSGDLNGLNAGGRDAFVSKYDGIGNLLWTRQLGTAGQDESLGVSADGLGSVYISGYTGGTLSGANAGEGDAFVSKYDGIGNLLWTRQLGTAGQDESCGVSADRLGNVYLSGHTEGSLDGPNAGEFDAFVSKYDAAGNFVWTRQLGTLVNDASLGVSADGLGNVYVSGQSYGNLGGPNAGYADAFVSKYDAIGNLFWTRQLGSPSYDVAHGISADRQGNVYISGLTYGSLGGPRAGGYSAFIAKISNPAVPEPSTLALAAMCILCAVLGRRTRFSVR